MQRFPSRNGALPPAKYIKSDRKGGSKEKKGRKREGAGNE